MEEAWQVQLDEIQALEAILSENFLILSVNKDGEEEMLLSQNGSMENHRGVTAADVLRETPPPVDTWKISMRIAIVIDPPEESGWRLTVSLPLCRESERQDIDNLYRVGHLPPILMDLTFTPNYPEVEPPGVMLSSMWLNERKCEALQRDLLSEWEVCGPGVSIVYAWIDWLQHVAATKVVEQCLPEGFDVVVLRDEDQEDDLTENTASRETSSSGEDNREDDVESSSVRDRHTQRCCNASGVEHSTDSLDRKLMALLQYDATKEYQLFLRNIHRCSICFEELRGSEFLRLDCRHFFCRSCLSEQARIHVEEGSLEGLKCPDTECGQEIGYRYLKQLLNEEEFERWERLTLQKALDTMEDASYCPRCGMLALEDPEDNCADCPKCLFVFCTLCQDARHPGTQCVSAETKLEMLRCRANGGGTRAVEELRRKENELLSLREVEKLSKPCPSCGARIQREQGCNKVVCVACHQAMCWRCGKKILGYEHFRETASSCVLFDEAEILRWERQIAVFDAHNAAAFRNDYLGELAGAPNHNNDIDGGGGAAAGETLRSVNCPNCGQPNYKFNRNNHMLCWSCTKHFCACCKMMLPRRGGGMHFGPKGCKQHS